LCDEVVHYYYYYYYYYYNVCLALSGLAIDR